MVAGFFEVLVGGIWRCGKQPLIMLHADRQNDIMINNPWYIKE
jgi:hypothetical protein